MPRTLLVLLVLVLGCVSLAWAAPKRALVLIYNSKDDHSVEVQLGMMTQLRSMRTAGHFQGAPDFSTSFQSLDLNVPAYAGLPKKWGMNGRVPIPYLALVSLANGKPDKIIWGQQVQDETQALGAMDRKLGLSQEPPAVGLPGGTVPQGGPPGENPAYTAQPGSNPPSVPSGQAANPAALAGWSTFTCPDGTFSVAIPQQAQLLQSEPAHLWVSGTLGVALYTFGYAPVPGLTNENLMDSLKEYADEYMKSAGITETSRIPLTVSIYPALGLVGVKGTESFRSLLFLCPPQARGYVLAGRGPNVDVRFFTSFYLHGSH